MVRGDGASHDTYVGDRGTGELVVAVERADVLEQQHEVRRQGVERRPVAGGRADRRGRGHVVVEADLSLVEAQYMSQEEALGAGVGELEDDRARSRALRVVANVEPPQQGEDADADPDRL